MDFPPIKDSFENQYKNKNAALRLIYSDFIYILSSTELLIILNRVINRREIRDDLSFIAK